MTGRPHSRRKKKVLGRPIGIDTPNILALSRLSVRLSQKEIAEATNCSQSYVSKVEKGRDPDAMYLYKFAKAVGIRSIGDFFEAYAKETLDRISQTIKAASSQYQSSPAEETNIGQQESSPPPSAPTDSPVDERLNVDSQAPTFRDVGVEL